LTDRLDDLPTLFILTALDLNFIFRIVCVIPQCLKHRDLIWFAHALVLEHHSVVELHFTDGEMTAELCGNDLVLAEFAVN
jgi:hypothetical protein